LLSALAGNALDCAASIPSDLIQQGLGSFLTPDMPLRNTRRFASCFGINGKQFVHPRHDRSCNRVSGI